MEKLVAAQQYMKNQITTTKPEAMVMMLYEGVIRFLRSALNELENGNLPEKAKLIEKAVIILDCLQTSLDKEKGGEIAENLNKLYDYILVELTEANLKNDAKKIIAVIELIKPVKDAWSEIVNNAQSNQRPIVQAPAAYGPNAKPPDTGVTVRI